MNAIQQFFELVAARFYEIEREKQAERAEYIRNVTRAYRKGEISKADYEFLIEQVRNGGLK